VRGFLEYPLENNVESFGHKVKLRILISVFSHISCFLATLIIIFYSLFFIFVANCRGKVSLSFPKASLKLELAHVQPRKWNEDALVHLFN